MCSVQYVVLYVYNGYNMALVEIIYVIVYVVAILYLVQYLLDDSDFPQSEFTVTNASKQNDDDDYSQFSILTHCNKP